GRRTVGPEHGLVPEAGRGPPAGAVLHLVTEQGRGRGGGAGRHVRQDGLVAHVVADLEGEVVRGARVQARDGEGLRGPPGLGTRLSQHAGGRVPGRFRDGRGCVPEVVEAGPAGGAVVSGGRPG